MIMSFGLGAKRAQQRRGRRTARQVRISHLRAKLHEIQSPVFISQASWVAYVSQSLAGKHEELTPVQRFYQALDAATADDAAVGAQFAIPILTIRGKHTRAWVMIAKQGKSHRPTGSDSLFGFMAFMSHKSCEL